LTIDDTEPGRGLGQALLKDALPRASQAADIISAGAVLVHAIDEEAKAFYEHFGFEEARQMTPSDAVDERPSHLLDRETLVRFRA
jgi:GNAT superfamily N-acetyltransferase